MNTKKNRAEMCRHFFKFGSVALVNAAFVVSAVPAHSQTIIIEDNFTNGSPYGSQMAGFDADGLSPDTVNLPGGTWQATSQDAYDSSEYTGSTLYASHPDFASPRNNAAEGISLMSTGGYVEPDTLIISAGINPIGTGSNAPTEAFLGFYTSPITTQYTNFAGGNFLGLSVTTAGSLNFVYNNTDTATSITPGTSIFDADGFTTLSYQLSFNPTTDSATISNIDLNGTVYSDTLTATGLSPDSIDYAGIGGYSNGSPGAAYTNFEVQGVEPVPEPTTALFLPIGLLCLVAYFRRRTSV